MSNIVLTLIIAFVIILIAFAGIGLGLLITGKMGFKLGTCGRNPKQKRDKECGKDVSCSICQPEQEDDDTKNVR